MPDITWYDDGHELTLVITPDGIRPVVRCPFAVAPSRAERPCHREFELHAGECGVAVSIAEYVTYCDRVSMDPDERFEMDSILDLVGHDRIVAAPLLVEWTAVSGRTRPMLRPSAQAPTAQVVEAAYATAQRRLSVPYLGPITVLNPDGTRWGPGARHA